MRRRDVLGLAVEWLSGAVDEFRSTYLERFAADVGRNLALVTAGAHGEVRLDDHFTFALRGKGNSWQPLERFSRGTVDACLLGGAPGPDPAPGARTGTCR